MTTEAIILNEITSRPMHTWGYIGGSTTLRGDVSGWRLGIGSDESCLTDANATVLSENTNFSEVAKHINYSDMSGPQTTWLAIPIATEGWRTFYTAITHSFNVGVEVSSYLMPDISGRLSSSGTLLNTLFWAQALSEGTELPRYSEGGKYNVSPGGVGRSEFAQTPLGVLVVKIEILGTPTTGNLRIGVERQQ